MARWKKPTLTTVDPTEIKVRRGQIYPRIYQSPLFFQPGAHVPTFLVRSKDRDDSQVKWPNEVKRNRLPDEIKVLLEGLISGEQVSVIVVSDGEIGIVFTSNPNLHSWDLFAETQLETVFGGKFEQISYF